MSDAYAFFVDSRGTRLVPEAEYWRTLRAVVLEFWRCCLVVQPSINMVRNAQKNKTSASQSQQPRLWEERSISETA